MKIRKDRIVHYLGWYGNLRGRNLFLIDMIIDYMRILAYLSAGGAFIFLTLNITVPPILVFIVPAFMELFRVSFNYLDVKKLGLWKKQNEISTRWLNPYFKKLEKDIEEIKARLNE